MKHILLILTLTILTGCAQTPPDAKSAANDQELVGTWKAKVQFSNGMYASIKDLEMMYVFNTGGTMTESSNYDAAPPVPPAYGVWRNVGPHTYEERSEFYMTRPPDSAEIRSGVSGWLPAGHGVLFETITVANDGKSYKSLIKLEMYDQSGKPVEGGGDAAGEGVSLGF